MSMDRMSSNDRPTFDDLSAALLAALSDAGHPADARDGAIVFHGDGASVPVAIDAGSTSRWRSKPASITLNRYGTPCRRFAPRSGAFDWPLVAAEAQRIATVRAADKERAAERARLVAVARKRAAALNAALGLGPGAALRAEASGSHMVLSLRDTEAASEEQIRAMVAAARACGLLPPAPAAAGEGEGEA